MTPEPAINVEAFKKFEREGYSRVAQGYDKATAIVTSQVNDHVLDAVGTGPGVSVLDVACGPGWLSAAAVQRGAVVTALDFAENMVAIAEGAKRYVTARGVEIPTAVMLAVGQKP